MVGPFTVVVVLLAMAGTLKLADPRPTADAISAARLTPWSWPSSPAAVRALGAIEIAIAGLALAVGGRVAAALVAVAYLAFTGFVARSLRGGASVSCGCFGRSDAPMTGHHVAYDLGAAAAAVGAMVADVPPLADTLETQPAFGAPFAVLVAVSVHLSVAMLTVLPATRRVAVSASGRRVRPFAIARRP